MARLSAAPDVTIRLLGSRTKSATRFRKQNTPKSSSAVNRCAPLIGREITTIDATETLGTFKAVKLTFGRRLLPRIFSLRSQPAKDAGVYVYRV